MEMKVGEVISQSLVEAMNTTMEGAQIGLQDSPSWGLPKFRSLICGAWRSDSDTTLRMAQAVGSSTSYILRRRTNAKTQTRKKQIGGLGPGAWLHGHELF